MDKIEGAPGPRSWGKIIAAVVGYLLATRISFFFPDSFSSLMVFWPAAGVGLAAFVLVEKRSWPILALCLYVMGNLSNLLQDRPLLGSLGWMLANVLESWLGALVVIGRGSERRRFDRPADIIALIVASTIVNGFTALIGAGTATLVTHTDFANNWFSWWVADGLGMLITAPFIIAWLDVGRIQSYIRPRMIPEFLAFFLIWTLFSWLSFNPNSLIPLLKPHPYLLALLIAWPALRFSMRSMTLALNILTLLAIMSDAARIGPSPMNGDNAVERLLYIESFLAVISMTAYLLSAALADSREAKERAEDSLANLKALGDSIPDGLVYQLVTKKDGSRRFVYLSTQLAGLTGIAIKDALADAETMYSRIHPQDLPALRAAENRAAEVMEDFHASFRMMSVEGGWRWVRVSSSPRALGDGSILWNGVEIDVTHEREVEDELRLSEARYRTILERAADGIFISDVEGRFVEVNERAAEMLGYSKAEVLSLRITDVVEPADLARLPLPYDRFADGSPYTTERRVVRKDGSVIDVEISAKGIGDGNVAGIVRDVTERKWNERLMRFRLRLSERAAAESLEEVLRIIIDEAEAITGSAMGFCHFVGEDGRELELQGWSTATGRLCALEGKRGHAALDRAGIWARAVELGRPVIHNDYASLEGRKGIPEGHLEIVRTLVMPMRKGDRTIAVLGVGNKPNNYDDSDLERVRALVDLSWDIVERMRANELLSETEERFAAVFRGSPLATTISGLESGIIVDANDAAVKVLGYPRSELIGRSKPELGIYVDPDDRAKIVEYVKGRDSGTWETRFRRKGGEIFDVIVSVEIVHIRGEHFLVSQMLDVTERLWTERMTALRLRLAESTATESLDRLLTIIVDEAESFTGSSLGFYHFIEEDGATIALQTWSTNTLAKECRVVPREFARRIVDAGRWADAAREMRPVVHNDYPALPAGRGSPPGHPEILRELVVPISRGGRVRALLGVGNKATNYDDSDVERMRELGDLSWEIVERKRTQDLLLETEERFAAVFRGSPLPTSITLLETGIFIDVNDAYLQLFGFERGELIGATPMKLGMYERVEERGMIVERLLGQEPRLVVDIRIRKKDGSVLDTVTAYVLIHSRGRSFIVTQIQDVTERRKAELALRKSEAGLRLAQDMARIGDWSLEVPSGKFHWSEGMYRIFGVTPGTFDPTLDAWLALVHPDDRERVELSMGELEREGRSTSRLEYRLVWPDGSLHTVVGIPGEALRDSGGAILRISGVYQDVTERKKAEEKILRALAEKEVLLRELYHRANNNMQIITALLEFQAQEISDDRLTRVIADTQDRIGSIALVNRKLYEAKDLSHIDLREYIEELADILTRSYEGGAGRIRLVPDLEEVRVLIDTAIPCGLILNELMSNVFKHAYPGDRPGDIVVRLRKGADGVIRLRVADHGVGVPPGFDFMKDGRIGLQSIVGLCASQLRGEILFDTKDGLACEIRFSDNLYEARI